MAGIEDVPSDWINKAGIAKRHSISRITVDRYLKKLEKEGRLFPIKVQQGKRTLYSYDPNDLDDAFKSLLQKNKKQTIVQKNVSVVANVQTQSQIELLRMNLQNAEKRILNWRSKIALVPQEIYLSEDSVKRNIAFGLSKDQAN